jgi:hypothetical protein
MAPKDCLSNKEKHGGGPANGLLDGPSGTRSRTERGGADAALQAFGADEVAVSLRLRRPSRWRWVRRTAPGVVSILQAVAYARRRRGPRRLPGGALGYRKTGPRSRGRAGWGQEGAGWAILQVLGQFLAAGAVALAVLDVAVERLQAAVGPVHHSDAAAASRPRSTSSPSLRPRARVSVRRPGRTLMRRNGSRIWRCRDPAPRSHAVACGQAYAALPARIGVIVLDHRCEQPRPCKPRGIGHQSFI